MVVSNIVYILTEIDVEKKIKIDFRCFFNSSFLSIFKEIIFLACIILHKLEPTLEIIPTNAYKYKSDDVFTKINKKTIDKT